MDRAIIFIRLVEFKIEKYNIVNMLPSKVGTITILDFLEI